MNSNVLLLSLLAPCTVYANLGDSRVEAISRYGPEVAAKALPGMFAYTADKQYWIYQLYDSGRAIAVVYVKREHSPTAGELVPFSEEEWRTLQELNLPTTKFPAEPSTTEPSRLSPKYERRFWVSTDAHWGMCNAPAVRLDHADQLNDMLIFGTLEGMYVVNYSMRHLGEPKDLTQ